MLNEIKKNKLAYGVLLIGLISGVILFLGSWPDRSLQRIVAAGIAVYYMLWGILTHLKEERITKKVVLEYLGVGLLAGLLLIMVTL